MSPDDLPGLDALARPLSRLRGFGFFVCAVPSRGAALDAEEALRALASDAARRVVTSDASVERGDLLLARPLQAEPRERARAFERLNLARDRLGAEGAALVVLLLEDDFADFARLATDLWSVRTLAVRHGAMPHGARPRAKPLKLPRRHKIPPALDAATSRLSLEGLHIEPEHGRYVPPPSLDDLYLPLMAVGPPPERSHVDRTDGPALEELTRYSVCVLEGDAGSGKSTILKALARRLARMGQPVVLIHAPRLDLERAKLTDLPGALAAMCRQCSWRPEPAQRPWLLLDGLDEVPHGPTRDRLAMLADDLARADAVRGAVLTARPAVIPTRVGEATGLGALTRLRVQPLTDRDIERYLRCWVRGQVDADHRAEHLRNLRAAARQPRIARLCRRPLFLAAIAVLVWSRGADLVGEYDVLDAFVNALIHRRKVPLAGDLSHADLRHLAGDVAWELYRAGGYGAPRDELLAEATTIDAFALSALRVATGLLVDDAEWIQFVHASLQDVLVAEQAVSRLDDLGRWKKLIWAEPEGLGTAVGRLFTERMASVRPHQLVRFFEAQVGDTATIDVANALHNAVPHFDIQGLQSEVWPRRAPLILRPVLKRVEEFQLRVNRTPEIVAERPILGRVSADIISELAPSRLGEHAFADIDPRWAVARWPVTNRLFAEFIEAGGYGERRWWTALGWRWRNRSAASRSKEYPERWGLPTFSGPNQPVCGISHHEAAAFVAWGRLNIEPRLCLLPGSVWQRVVAHAPTPAPASRDVPEAVGGAVHCATQEGIEDLGGLVRQWLAPGPEGHEQYGGFGFCDPARALDEISTRHGSGRRWYHPFGLRLALDRQRR